MKHIVKQPEPAAFSAWKAAATQHWTPSYGALDGTTKQALKQALMAEQGGICCYCERRLTEHDSHIEHFRPQSDAQTDPLDYGNMLCSCQNQTQRGEPRHCGHLKQDWFDEALLVSPLEPTCERRFSFTGDGRIQPRAADAAASETIRRLGLDIPKLRALRAKAIEPFTVDTLSRDEFARFVEGYLQQGTDGLFGEFWTTIRDLFGGVVSP